MKTEAPTDGSAPGAGPAAVRYDHVLVPLDSSAFADVALDTAIVLARRFDAQLNAITVVTNHETSDAERSPAGIGSDEVHVEVVAGDDVATEIERYADRLAPCIVCMSTHGRGRIAGSFIGSAARTLLRQSAQPIVVVGPSAREPSFVDHWPAPLSTPHLVACVDGTAASEAVIPVAAGWAKALDMALTLLIIAKPVPPALRPNPVPEAGNLTEAQAVTYVEGLAATWSSQVSRITGVVALDPISTAQGVKAYLDAHPAGLVAATTRNRHGLQRIRFGATVASVVHASVVPVLVVPLDD